MADPVFSHMKPGDYIEIFNAPPNDMVDAFRVFCAQNGKRAWKCYWWTDHECDDADKKIPSMYLARVDTLTDEEITEIKRKALADRFKARGGKRFFIVDGKEFLKAYPEGMRIRGTSYGWENMKVRERKFVRIRMQNLRNALVKFVGSRKLDWYFECERDTTVKREPWDDPYWVVTRIR